MGAKEFLKTKRFWAFFAIFSIILIIGAIISDVHKPSKCNCVDAYENYILTGKDISEWSDCVHSYQKEVNIYLKNSNLKLMPDNSGSFAGSWETGAYEYFKAGCNGAPTDDVDKSNTIIDSANTSISSNESKDSSNNLTVNDNIKRFSSDGLKYKTLIEIHFISPTKVTGSIENIDLGTGTSTDKVNFTGIKSGDKLNVQFNDKKPVIGDNSQWTNSPWIIKNVNGKETLNIQFFAKNYDTNKWENSNYEFTPSN